LRERERKEELYHLGNYKNKKRVLTSSLCSTENIEGWGVKHFKCYPNNHQIDLYITRKKGRELSQCLCGVA